ncbi:hypothetical protein SAMN04487948_114113 [Halogranum amylolyticum]|uniref:Uncharacterized protein n=1 Tax=Halogranum amylolyticum TaxID=660520 RepID=A0A1H8V743_9EURY|nr:hypothetical protein [Halogranum amylolyticum]SEP11292.1 hypothetical protein SAMN04487948_114113 [Halogranum amylolyticum]
MANSGYNYSVACTHCGAKPFSEGPHHDPDCDRHQSELATESELVQSKQCRYCNVRPFIAGPHHASDCRRFFDVKSTTTPSPNASEEEIVSTESRQITFDDILAIFRSAEVPLLTAEEVAETLDCSSAVAHGGLAHLVDRGTLYKKRVTSESEVFLLIEKDSES